MQTKIEVTLEQSQQGVTNDVLGNTSYQALIQQTQVSTLSDLEKFKKTNEASMQVMRNHISNLKSELRSEMQSTMQNQNNAFKNELTNDIKNMMASFFQMNTASTSGMGPIPSNTIANPKEFVEYLALALMPLSIWEKLSLHELTPTQMILELADRSTTRPAGIAEDVFVKVRKFHLLTDFVVVDYVVDPRVPLISGRSFLRTGRALINVYGEELMLGSSFPSQQ
nr:reverse transcriptase domain-containing protein [Tanacetum cinerariifolium]